MDYDNSIDSSNKKFQEFLLQCKLSLHVKLRTYTSDNAKVTWPLSLSLLKETTPNHLELYGQSRLRTCFAADLVETGHILSCSIQSHYFKINITDSPMPLDSEMLTGLEHSSPTLQILLFSVFDSRPVVSLHQYLLSFLSPSLYRGI